MKKKMYKNIEKKVLVSIFDTSSNDLVLCDSKITNLHELHECFVMPKRQSSSILYTILLTLGITKFFSHRVFVHRPLKGCLLGIKISKVPIVGSVCLRKVLNRRN